jgi:CBS domain-containing protein
VAVRGVVQLISHFNDALTLKLIRLLESEEGITLPPGAAYIVMGSEGRGEQTLRTDQDSAIAYRDGIAAEELMEARRFAERVVFALAEIGVPLCPGNMMANNPEWFHSLTEWRRMISDWVSNSGPEETMRFGVFQDLRVIHGERSFENSIRNHIADSVRSNALFLRNLASDILRFEPPLGLFSRLLVERKGGNRGKLDLKKGGLFVLTRGVALLALEIGVVGGTTWSRLEQLRQVNQFSAGDLDEIEDAFTFLTRLRLEKQLESHVNGTEPGNHIDPLTLSDRDRIHLRQSFKTVAMFLRLLKSHYNLGIIAP